MLGSLAEADDVVQDAWLRFSRADTSDVQNLRGWLTTVVARLCLERIRARKARPSSHRASSFPSRSSPMPMDPDPEQEALLADSVGLALMIVLDTLTPAERLAFVLHDVFAIPFEEIAPIVDRTPTATRQLASRARRRVQGHSRCETDADLAEQWQVVEAFVAASREGDFNALIAILDPDVVARADFGRVQLVNGGAARGPEQVARQALSFRALAGNAKRALINGAPGAVAYTGPKPFAVVAFTIRNGRIVEIDILGDPDRLARLDMTVLDA